MEYFTPENGFLKRREREKGEYERKTERKFDMDMSMEVLVM